MLFTSSAYIQAATWTVALPLDRHYRSTDTAVPALLHPELDLYKHGQSRRLAGIPVPEAQQWHPPTYLAVWSLHHTPTYRSIHAKKMQVYKCPRTSLLLVVVQFDEGSMGALLTAYQDQVDSVHEDGTVVIEEVQANAPPALDRIDQTDLPLDGLYHYFNQGTAVNVYVVDTVGPPPTLFPPHWCCQNFDVALRLSPAIVQALQHSMRSE